MATKTFPYAVIYDGKLYSANTPIKIKEEVKVEQKTAKTTKKAVTENDEGTSQEA